MQGTDQFEVLTVSVEAPMNFIVLFVFLTIMCSLVVSWCLGRQEVLRGAM